MKVGRGLIIFAAVAIGVAGSSLYREGRAQTPPKIHQALQADLAGMADHETLVHVIDFPAGGSAPWHTHPDAHEIAYVLEGNWTSEIEGQEPKKLKPGDSFYIAPNLVHRASNDGSAPTKLLIVRIKPKGQPITIAAKR